MKKLIRRNILSSQPECCNCPKNCSVSVAGFWNEQVPTLMALLFSVCPRNANLVLNSPCLGGFQCHFSQQLVITTVRFGDVFCPLLKGPWYFKGSKIDKAKKWKGASTYSLLIKVFIPQGVVKSVYLYVSLVVVRDKLGRRNPNRRTWWNICRDWTGICVYVLEGSCFLSLLPLGLQPTNDICGCKSLDFCLSNGFDVNLAC